MKDLLFGNLRYKLIAIFLALLAWVYVHATPYPGYITQGFGVKERNINLPVQYENLGANLRLMESTEFVDLVIREETHTFAPNQALRAFVDLKGIEAPGRYFLEIQTDLPRWMNLLSQRPKYALIIVEEVTE